MPLDQFDEIGYRNLNLKVQTVEHVYSENVFRTTQALSYECNFNQIN